MSEGSINTNKKVYGYKRASYDAVYLHLAYKCVFGDEVLWPGDSEAGLAGGELVVCVWYEWQFTPVRETLNPCPHTVPKTYLPYY